MLASEDDECIVHREVEPDPGQTYDARRSPDRSIGEVDRPAMGSPTWNARKSDGNRAPCTGRTMVVYRGMAHKDRGEIPWQSQIGSRRPAHV